MAGITLYASLFESSLFKPDIKRIDLYELPKTHKDGPALFNVSRYFDMPQVVAMAAEPAPIAVKVDTTEVPELAEWADKAKALVEKWHPIIIER